ncbi:hypothetical protein V6N12_022421 [Hibiscus sabdariffa]|uniref:Uncharacterized protein n=1 Tax=Hibiscus sabdariffa TaxID=183260 RepID=A0ABR2FUN1_9ROSI
MSMLAMDTVPVAAQHASHGHGLGWQCWSEVINKLNSQGEDCAAISRAHTPRYMRCSPSHPHKTYLTNLSNPGTGSLSSSSQAVKIFAPAFAANPNLDPQPKPQPQPQPVVEEPSY